MTSRSKYEAVVIGTSAGGLFVLSAILESLPAGYPLPILIVQHRARDHRKLLEELLQAKCRIRVKQADEKERIENSIVYIAPPDYHLLVESDKTLSLSYDSHVSYSRPSIDVLFESAAEAYKDKLVAIILTGANSDGATGIQAVYNNGGMTIAQSSKEAEYPAMPTASIKTGKIKKILTIPEIQTFLLNLVTDK